MEKLQAALKYCENLPALRMANLPTTRRKETPVLFNNRTYRILSACLRQKMSITQEFTLGE